MTGRRIKLNNGAVYEGGKCGYSDGFLWCFVKEPIQDVALVFLDKEATERIQFEYGTLKDTYVGFTQVFYFQAQDSGCAVCMTKPTTEVKL